MTGILLAAGKGTRLGAVTETTPKCLLPVGGRPILKRWLDWWSTCDGLDKVVINLHHLSDQVEHVVEEIRAGYPFHVLTRFEPELLGTGASVHRYATEHSGGAPVLVGYADTLIEHDLNQFLQAHRWHRPQCATILLFDSPAPSQSGVVSLDSAGYVRSIEEKPARPQESLAFAGLAVLELACLQAHAGGTDLVRDYLAPASQTASGVYGVRCTGRVLDIGTPERWATAEGWTT